MNEAFDENNNKKNGNAILQEYDYPKGGYGYYENVYGNLTEEIVNNISNGSYLFPGETPQIDMTHAVKVPVESGNQTTNAKSFTDGTDDFSAIDEADTAIQETGQPDISADSAQFGSAAENAFSSGDFSMCFVFEKPSPRPSTTSTSALLLPRITDVRYSTTSCASAVFSLCSFSICSLIYALILVFLSSLEAFTAAESLFFTLG